MATVVKPERSLRGLAHRRPTAVRAALAVVSFTLLFAIWGFGAAWTSYVPPIGEVFGRATTLLAEPGELASIIGASLRRLVVGVAVGYSAAVLATLLMRRSRFWGGFLAPFVLAAASTPSLVAALLGVMIFGFSEVAVYTATAVVLFPYVLLSLTEGFGNLDSARAEMAAAFNFSRYTYYRHVALPEMGPHLFAALRTAHALGWKIVVLTEMFGLTGGIGLQYTTAYELFDLTLLVSWIMFFLIVVWAAEYGILRPIEKVLFKWRMSAR